MNPLRQLNIGHLEQLRQKIKTLEAQAAGQALIIEMKTSSMKHNLAKLDIDTIYQAAKDLHTSITHLREAKELADELNAELYD